MSDHSAPADAEQRTPLGLAHRGFRGTIGAIHAADQIGARAYGG